MTRSEVDTELARLLTDLSAAKVAVREAAVTALTGGRYLDRAQDLLGALADTARHDENLNIRRDTVERLAAFGGLATETLVSVLQDDKEEQAVRRAAAGALGASGTDAALSELFKIVVGREDEGLRGAAVGALSRIGTRSAGDRLLEAADYVQQDELRARIVTALRQTGTTRDAPPVLARLVAPPTGEATRAAAVKTLAALAGVEAIPHLATLAAGSDDDSVPAKLRLRAVIELAELQKQEAVPPLVRSLLCDPVREIKLRAADGLAAMPVSPALLDEFLRCGEKRRLTARNVDKDLVARALDPSVQQGHDAGTDPVTRLLQEATRHEDGWPFLVALLLAVCGDATAAGAALNDYDVRAGEPQNLRWLRIELGGNTALDPILAQLRSDLRDYFQVPVHALNEQTRTEWQKTLSDARWGFRIRMAMSVIVFAVGVLLIVASASKFLFGHLDTAAAWGTGGTLAGGVGAMLAVVYTGPLRDIRQSVRDLGTSNAVFIQYVHRILQGSHVFTSLYLREQLTVENSGAIAGLMRDAMTDSVTALRAETGDTPPAT